MADHLTRLAARALGQAPSVAPRLPSRFEASRFEASRFEASRFEPAQAEPELGAPSWDRDEPAHGELIEDELVDGEPAAGRRPRPGRDPAGVPGPVDLRLPGAGAASRPPRTRAAREPSAATPAHPEQPPRSDPGTGVAAGWSPQTTHTGQTAVRAGSGRSGEPVQGAPVVPVTPAAPASPVPASRPASREPSVRISIGRIEVRAVPGPAARPPAAPAPATPPRSADSRPPEPAELTLSAYLSGDRGRARGDRGWPR
ncbi:MAG TPA: hypothetical protein VFM55_14920 [Micromonosporaceae bacterium]|nr:hypothetical protein [Micromonosporaceae bacterium]